MTDAFSDANAIVTQVSQNGAESAARLLIENVNNARDDFQEPSLNKVGNGFNNYMTVLSDELQKSGVLPELSIGWAKANIDVIGNGRSISDNDIRKFEHAADNSTNPVDRMLIKSLKEQAPDVKYSSTDQNGRETVITANDLNNRLDFSADHRQYSLPDELGKNPNALRAQVLFEKGENGRDLFDFLDGIRNEGERDGKVDRNDLVTFNEMVKTDPEFRANFTPQQIRTAHELESRWDYEGAKIHDRGFFKQELTRESVAKGIGFEDVPAQVPMEKALNQPDELNNTVALDYANEIDDAAVNEPSSNRDAIDQSESDQFNWAPEDESAVSSRTVQRINEAFNNRDAIHDGSGSTIEAVSDLFRDATQRVGEGPYQVATRLLPGASHREIMQLTRAMKSDYQQRTGDHSDRMVHMRVGENFLNPSNIEKILASSPALRNRLQNCARR